MERCSVRWALRTEAAQYEVRGDGRRESELRTLRKLFENAKKKAERKRGERRTTHDARRSSGRLQTTCTTAPINCMVVGSYSGGSVDALVFLVHGGSSAE